MKKYVYRAFHNPATGSNFGNLTDSPNEKS